MIDTESQTCCTSAQNEIPPTVLGRSCVALRASSN